MKRFALEDIQATDVTGTSLASDRFTEERVRRSVVEILDSDVLLSIATVTPEGRAHIHTAYFSYSEELRLHFLSHPGSLHCRNLSSNPSMAATVFPSRQQWTDPGQGVQLFGTGEQTSGSSEEEAERCYRRRFPTFENWKAALKVDDPARQYRFYRFDVTTVKILDEKNLGDAAFVRASVVR